MKRPTLANFLAIITDDFLSVKAGITLAKTPEIYANIYANVYNRSQELKAKKLPIEAYRLLNSHQFAMKIIGHDSQHREVFKKTYDSDSFGNFFLKIPKTPGVHSITSLQLYEVKKRPGIEWLLGSYIPIRIMGHKKIVICDFDKTLVETKYSSTKEVYHSLTSPLSHFPSLPKSIEILKRSIADGHHPFILSASPHFYEDAMRDWLYQNKIYTAGIFLKDYRQIFSLFEGNLAPKDIKAQGIYKLGHLLDIVTMTGVPHELILMGDNFESDPIIYLSFAKMLEAGQDARAIWQSLKDISTFHLSRRQDSKFLSKIYQIHSSIMRFKQNFKTLPQVKIYIRKKADEKEIIVPEKYKEYRDYMDTMTLLELYDPHKNDGANKII